MPYRYFEDIATADTAFEAWGGTVEELFTAAAEATMNVMIEDLDAIELKEQRSIFVADEAMDLLLFKFLNELLFYKDAEELLLRVKDLHIRQDEGRISCAAEVYGEQVNAVKHTLNVDIKAVTFHRFEVKQTKRGWDATVVLDI